MTEQTQNEQAQVVVQEKVDAPAEWGSRKEIAALANRLKDMMPGKLSREEALLLAQYSAAVDANPFRGEIYAYKSKGKLILVEGYKLLVRWARRQCQFYERYERITNETDDIPDDAIAFRCRILRDDAVNALARLADAGVPFAYEICSIEAVGVVTKADRTTRQGEPSPPPRGWTWEDVARKRALKNALNRAYGAPSPREVAEETWKVEDTLTTPEDWTDVTPEMSLAERDATALYNARRRLSTTPSLPFREAMDQLGFSTEETESPLEHFRRQESPEPEVNTDLLFGPAMEDPSLPETPPEPELVGKTGQTLDGGPETLQGAAAGDAEASPWHNRSQLIGDALEAIPYYSHGKHVIAALGILETEKKAITFESNDEACLKLLQAYAKARADEKADSES